MKLLLVLCLSVISAMAQGSRPRGAAGGDLEGNYPDPVFHKVNSAPGACGDSTHVCMVTTDNKGRILTQLSVGIAGSPGAVVSSSDLNDQTNVPALTPGDAVVDVTSNVFTDESSHTSTTTISVGQTVSWKWVSGLHVVVSLSAHCGSDPCASLEDERFDSGDPTSTAGHRFAYTFTAPGTYYYYCDVHGQMMQGTVIVVQTATLHTPSSSSEPCPVGRVTYDSAFIYICTAPTTWVRAVLGSF